MTWILLYVLTGILVLIYSLLYAVSKISLPSVSPPGLGSIENLLGLPLAIPFALSILSSFGTVLAVVLMASFVGNEYNWGTIRIALICAESRWKFLGAKLISIIIAILTGMIIGVATGFVMSLITTAIGNYAFNFNFATGEYIWSQFLQFWRTFYIIMLYALLGFLFAVVGRSAMPGIAVSIGVLFLESIITTLMRLAGGWVAKIPNYLLTANVDAINALNQIPQGFAEGRGGGLIQLPPINQAYTVLTVYILVFVAIAFYLFRRRDVVK